MARESTVSEPASLPTEVKEVLTLLVKSAGYLQWAMLCLW
jgi:hypothetical protein